MQHKLLFFTVLIGLFALHTQAQNTSPFWSLAGNSNSNAVSKLGTTIAEPLNLITNNLTRLRIGTDGKVGIGTSTPQQLLHVEGSTLLNIFVNTSPLGSISGSGQIGYAKALPTASGQRLGYFLVGSRGGAENNYNSAGMVGYAAGNWTAGSSYPTYLAFETTPSGSASRNERLRITSSGNVGIGTTSPGTRLQAVAAYDGDGISVVGSASGPKDAAFVLTDDIGNGGTLGLASANNAFMSGLVSGDMVLTARSGKLHFGTGPAIGFPTMTVSGNKVGIGTTSPTFLLDVAGRMRLQNEAGGNTAGLWLNNTSNSGYTGFMGVVNDNHMGWYGAPGWSLVMNTDNGYVGIGDAAPANKFVVTDNTRQTATAQIKNLFQSSGWNDGLYITAGNNAGSSSSAWYIGFYRPDGNSCGSISQSSATSVSYNTASDKRLKENIRETHFGLADINKIQVKDYNFIGSKTEQTGFLAQQLYEVFPEAVSKGGDDPKARPWMVDYGRITPLLVKAVQELSKKTDEVEELRKENADIKQQLAELKALVMTNSGTSAATISGASLEQSIPNPARSVATIRYNVPTNTTSARLTLVNAKGQVLKELSLNSSSAGQVSLNTANLPAGVYTYTLVVDGQRAASKQLVVAR